MKPAEPVKNQPSIYGEVPKIPVLDAVEGIKFVEGVLILRNSSPKFKTVVGNAILLNCAVSSENISKSIKIKTENGFYLKQNVYKFRRNKSRPEK